MKKICCISLLSLIYFVAFAQNIATVNGKSISSKEFMWVYKKNHGGIATATQQELTAYLNLYINFKLKVLEARIMGLDSDTAYKAEINGYEDALKTQKKTSSKNKDYDFILNEYKEGVLMFNISEMKIWSKVQDNENELRNYYTENSAAYDKGFEESKSQLIANYQQQLEQEWIKKLKLKYTVKINNDEVKKLAKL